MRRKIKYRFRKLANAISQWAGSAGVFLGACVVVLVWASTGPFFKFSDTWQLIINTGTTIVTFLMVFLIQNTQNRDTKAIQLKLDELIHATKTARDTFVGLEELTDEELAALDEEFKKLTQNPATTQALKKLRQKIEAEHTKRINLRNQASKVVGTILKPLTTTANSVVKHRNNPQQ